MTAPIALILHSRCTHCTQLKCTQDWIFFHQINRKSLIRRKLGMLFLDHNCEFSLFFGFSMIRRLVSGNIFHLKNNKLIRVKTQDINNNGCKVSHDLLQLHTLHSCCTHVAGIALTLHDCCRFCRVRIPKQSGECNNNSPEFKGINRRTFLNGSGLGCFYCMFTLPLHSCCTYIARFARKLHDYCTICTIQEIVNNARFDFKSKKYLDSDHIAGVNKMIMVTPIEKNRIFRLNHRSAE